MTPYDLVCFSQLRWNFVYQRPHHLMSRAARGRRVFYVEEPRITDRAANYLRRSTTPDGVIVCTPYLTRASQRPPDWTRARPRRSSASERDERTRRNDHAVRLLVEELFEEHRVRRPVIWCSTPMLAPVIEAFDASARVYDCMDELAAFKLAPREVLDREQLLLRIVDLVFTGGYSLYEAKRRRHPRVHNFPSAVDAEHFAPARSRPPEPSDLAGIPHPRLGFIGVIDERMDMRLVAELSRARREWQICLVGPVTKIRHRVLPEAPNIHYLGRKRYAELPAYLGHFDAGIMPFALNEATRFISPTKTLEYLAAGLPVASTPIVDVVRTFASRGLVEIGDGCHAFMAACERALATPRAALRAESDDLVAQMSWDATWSRMERLIAQAIALRALRRGGSADVATDRAAKSGARRERVAVAIRPVSPRHGAADAGHASVAGMRGPRRSLAGAAE